MSYWQSVLTQMGWPPQENDSPLESIALTSCGHGHGVSTVAMNVAAAASGSADVLLVDANVRRPALANLLQVPSSPGLVDALSGSGTPARVVYRSKTSGLSVLPVGTASNLSECRRERFLPLLRSLTADYDLVICDFPPIAPDADCLPWFLPMSRVFLVLQQGRIDAGAAHASTTILRRMGVDVSGVIVNQSGEKAFGS